MKKTKRVPHRTISVPFSDDEWNKLQVVSAMEDASIGKMVRELILAGLPDVTVTITPQEVKG